ncbi:hypothetical protein [Burkholderia gladioli]|uniref:hypothetical protein n=1 Tax=Burkholderia gladioli TaxID=28095 RepID=UPI000BBD272F|nr:hypothetical protein [Burkholderia gladioli]ATF87058.1 hypothetical protein CO712_05665 [Burkholderia gladioli pv. gladioli]
MKDIDEIRRDNLKRIESELGGPAAAASRTGMSHSQFTNLRDGAKDSKTGRPRGMRKATARKIEECTGKPPGWLDVDHGEPVEQVALPSPPVGWERLTRQQRAQVESFIGWLLTQSPSHADNQSAEGKRFGKGF